MGRGDYTDDPHQAVRDEPEAITAEQHARLFEHAAAKDDARRRAPLASSMEELQRALDALRERIQDENLQDARLRRAIDSVEHYAGIVQKRLRLRLRIRPPGAYTPRQPECQIAPDTRRSTAQRCGAHFARRTPSSWIPSPRRRVCTSSPAIPSPP